MWCFFTEAFCMEQLLHWAPTVFAKTALQKLHIYIAHILKCNNPAIANNPETSLDNQYSMVNYHKINQNDAPGMSDIILRRY